MSIDRRSQLSRRRRVISAQMNAGDAPVSRPRTRKTTSAEDDRPVVAYGARVQRRLRGRWFELVPVKQSSLIAVACSIVMITAGLVAGHYASMSWDRFANDPSLSRPLRLDNPASFGGWCSAMFAMLSAGVGILIYQLRRYRSDDYHGQYRIWRPVIAILVILSIDSVAGVLDWTGAIIDMLLSGKAPLAGGDWIRLLLCVVGFGYTARLIMEMRRCPQAAIWLLVGALAVSSRLLIRWSIVEPSPLVSAMIFGAAPLVGRAAVLLSMLTFLRMVYREVRGLDVPGEASRFQLPKFGRHREQADVEDEEPAPKAARKRSRKEEPEEIAEEPPKRGWFGRRKQDQDHNDDADQATEKRRWFGGRSRGEDEPDQEQDQAATKRSWFGRGANRDDEELQDGDEVDGTPKTKRGWFGGRGGNAQDDDGLNDDGDEEAPEKKRGWFGGRRKTQTDDAANEEAEEAPAEKRGWFGKGRQQAAADSDLDEAEGEASDEAPKKKGWFSRGKSAPQSEDSDAAEAEAGADEEPKRKKRGLGGWMKGRGADEESDTGEPDGQSAPQTIESDAPGDEEEIDFDNLDWSSMSKSERRRMKKLLRRQGKDAA